MSGSISVAKNAKLLFLALLIAGCQPKPPQGWDPKTVSFTNAMKMPPALPARAIAPLLVPYVAPPTQVDLPAFRYSVDPCLYTWVMQGSSNLVDWVSLDRIGGGCPTGAVDFTNTALVYFFRMKGTLPAKR